MEGFLCKIHHHGFYAKSIYHFLSTFFSLLCDFQNLIDAANSTTTLSRPPIPPLRVAMDPSLSANISNAPRKVKFAPKGPPRRERKFDVPKPEKIENDIDFNTAQGLLQRLNENALKAKPKSEKKENVLIFSQGFSDPLRDFSYGLRVNADPNAEGVAKQRNYELVFFTTL